jgi:NAD-dependent SIR2 family protein deacetylase
MLGLDFFLAHPEQSMPILRELFYGHFGKTKPNRAHEILAAWENEGWARVVGAAGSDGRGRLQVLITQDIDSVQLN